MQNLISFELMADFGFFRKPETNDGINLTYTMLHKPALLGILGAIIGLEGYKKKGEKPEYLEKLKTLKVGIKPKNDDKGNFQKMVIKYSNTIGYANKGTNYLTEEMTLIKPAYKCFLLLDLTDENHQKIKEYLMEGKAEFLPYLGKNEFSAWWDKERVVVHEFEEVSGVEEGIVIENLFLKTEEKIEKKITRRRVGFKAPKITTKSFVFFERLPIGFDETLFQYELGDFSYTNFIALNQGDILNLYHIQKGDYVQLH